MLTKNKLQSGYMLVEVLVASFLVVLAIGGAFGLIYSNLSSISFLEHRLIAIELAQEGVETVHAIRNSNYIHAASGGTGSTFNSNGLSQASCGSPTGCEVQCVNGGESFPDCSALGNDLIEIQLVPFSDTFLNYDVATAVYSQGGVGTESPFKRKITVTGNTDEVAIEVEVTWNQKGNTQSVEVETKLFNWLGI